MSMRLLTNIIATAILLSLYWLLTEYLPSYLKKKGENQAIKEDATKIEYESEKGKNLATKEDIEEITTKIEEVKSSISFEEQRRHNILEERKRSLLSVLYYVEKIQSLQMLAYYTMYSSSPVDRLYSIISDIQDTNLQLAHKSRMVMISFPDKSELSVISKLVSATNLYAVEICVDVCNFASKFSEKERLLDIYNSMPEKSRDVLQKATEAGETAYSIRDNLNFEHGKEVADRSSDYVCFLSKLYGKGFIVKG